MADVYRPSSKYTKIEITADNRAEYNFDVMQIGLIAAVNNSSGMIDAILDPTNFDLQFELIPQE